jgi:hypothetical protein
VQKQLYYLTNHELTAYERTGSSLVLARTFENNAAGWEQFGEYLELAPPVPSYLLVDLIEEDFQRENVPHVSGRGRQALLERRTSQLYRDTPFRHAQLQGREKEGRKDDRYLFSALTNADLPKPWLAALQAKTVPVVGMYSLASLSQQLFNKLGLDQGRPVLLVSHQSSGLRQSYFHEGMLRFSRLTPLFDHSPERLAETFDIETAKTRQFLASTRLLNRGEQVQVVVIANAESIDALRHPVRDSADVALRLLDITEVQALLKVGQFDTSGACEGMFLSLLASLRLPSHFPLRDLRHYYQLLQTRMALYVASGVLALGAVAWAASDVLTILDLRRQEQQFDQEAAGIDKRYKAIVGTMPVTTVSPHNMKSVVDLERMIDKNVPLPSVHLALLAGALDAVPEVKIHKLHWQAGNPATLLLPVDPSVPPPPAGLAPEAAQLGIPGASAQMLTLEGEIVPFNNDYRAALDSVNRLAAQIKRHPGVQAEVVSPPIDTRTTAKLESSTGGEAGENTARFTLKLSWKP